MASRGLLSCGQFRPVARGGHRSGEQDHEEAQGRQHGLPSISKGRPHGRIRHCSGVVGECGRDRLVLVAVNLPEAKATLLYPGYVTTWKR